MKGCLNAIVVLLIASVVLVLLDMLSDLLVFAWPLVVAVAIAFVGFKLYEVAYFYGSNFKSMKASVSGYVTDCNELNDHIHELESTKVPGSVQRGPGSASYRDVSRWNYSRAKLKAKTDATNVYNCSRTVCGNARNDPIKYVCKYFGLRGNRRQEGSGGQKERRHRRHQRPMANQKTRHEEVRARAWIQARRT